MNANLKFDYSIDYWSYLYWLVQEPRPGIDDLK
jgi:hypothetical protein